MYVFHLQKCKGCRGKWPITTKAYPSFHSIKQLEVLLLPPDGRMLIYHSLLPNILSGSPDSSLVPIYTPGWRGTVRVNCLAQEHNAMSRPGLKLSPLDPESSKLNIHVRPLHLTRNWVYDITQRPRASSSSSSSYLTAPVGV